MYSHGCRRSSWALAWIWFGIRSKQARINDAETQRHPEVTMFEGVGNTTPPVLLHTEQERRWNWLLEPTMWRSVTQSARIGCIKADQPSPCDAMTRYGCTLRGLYNEADEPCVSLSFLLPLSCLWSKVTLIFTCMYIWNTEVTGRLVLWSYGALPLSCNKSRSSHWIYIPFFASILWNVVFYTLFPIKR